MSKNEPWLLVFMALGANLKILIFDPPGVRPAYLTDTAPGPTPSKREWGSGGEDQASDEQASALDH